MSRCRPCNPLPEEVRQVADILERRWLLSIVYAAHSGAVRFNEFRQVLESIPPRTLVTRLTELEQAGILERRVIGARPPLVEYRLTERGMRMRSLLRAIRKWACESYEASSDTACESPSPSSSASAPGTSS